MRLRNLVLLLFVVILLGAPCFGAAVQSQRPADVQPGGGKQLPPVMDLFPPPPWFDPWPGPVSEPPGIMSPQIPWPGMLYHVLLPTNLLLGPFPYQYFQATLPSNPWDPERQVIIEKDRDGDVTLWFYEYRYDPELGTWVWVEVAMFEVPPWYDVQFISVWLGFSDWNDNGIIDDGDTIELVVSLWLDSDTRINFHYCMGADGVWWEC